MSCAYPGGRNAAEPAPLPIIARRAVLGGRRWGSVVTAAEDNLGCRRYHTAASFAARQMTGYEEGCQTAVKLEGPRATRQSHPR